MSKASLIEPSESKFPPLLLCLPGDAVAASELLGSQHCGKSLLFHQIVHYQSLGASQIMLSVEAVSGTLIALVDEFSNRDIVVDIVRSPNEILAKSAMATKILVAQAEIWFESAIICQIAESQNQLLATVEEVAENGLFERIDLNNRWAGIALLDFEVFKSASDLPEDWDLGSSLLRQALQHSPKMLRIRQSDVLAAKITHLIKCDNYSRFFGKQFAPRGWFEGFIFKPISSHMAKLAWQSPLAWNVANWSFPLMSFLSLITAFLDQPIAALLLAIFAIVMADIRQFVRVSEYRANSIDLARWGSWTILSLVLGLLLYNFYRDPFEAFFLLTAFVVLELLTMRLLPKSWISPLFSALVLFLGVISGFLIGVGKFLILLHLVYLLFVLRDKPVQS